MGAAAAQHCERKEESFALFFLPGRGEDLSGVGAYGVDGAVVTSDLSYGREVVYVPHLQHAAAAGAQQHGPAWDVGQRTHPVLVGVGDLLWSEGGEALRVRAGEILNILCFIKK